MLEDCVKYFKTNKSYKRILEELRKKWKKYGRASGYIDLGDASSAEREALKSFFGRTFSDETVKFKVSEFEKALQETKYRGISLQELLEHYFAEPMNTNKDVRDLRTNRKTRFFEKLIVEVQVQSQNESAATWLKSVIKNKKYGYNIVVSEYEKNEENAYELVISVCKAIHILSVIQQERIRLAILGADVTSNPHYFDKNQTPGKLLITALGYIHHRCDIKSAEEILELYYLSGIQPDDISSYTTLYGISLYCDTVVHKAYEEFINKHESYVVTLANLNKITKADCPSKVVFVFENQMVFSHMCEVMKERSVAMICTSGQLKTASLIVIDLLCKSCCKLYYSGDIDPEGLCIADKVISRHPDNIVPWRLNKEDYRLSVSNEKLEDIRIKKMDKINDVRLMEVVEELRVNKCAAYQEMLIEQMVEDMK